MSWDAAKLTTKYPWLRSDSEALEDFRAPFASSSSSSSSSSDADNERKDSPLVASRAIARKKLCKTRRQPEKLHKPNLNQHAAKETKPERLKLPPATRNVITYTQKQSSSECDLGDTRKAKSAHVEARLSPRQRKKKQKNRLLMLSLQLPALSTKKIGSTTTLKSADSRETIRIQDYSGELKLLHQAQEQLKNDVEARIEAERARLPLTFLFQRNLELRSYCKDKGVTIITQIFAKLQHRLLFSAFKRWQAVNKVGRREDRKLAIFKQSQERAIKLFERLVSDAYVGTIERAFQKWHQIAQSMKLIERNSAASVIQGRFRKRRAVALARVLKQASLDADYKRRMEIQQLLRFESYGTTMLWSSLRLGFNMVLQNHCARRIQFFFRRIVVQNRIDKRVAKRMAITKVQTQWRMHLARVDLSERKEAVARRRAEENRAATKIQTHARRLAARNKVNDLRFLKEHKQNCALIIQKWWRKCQARWVLQWRFEIKRQALLEERVQLERIRFLEEQQQHRQHAAINIQRVARGWFGRRVFKDMIRAKQLDQAARRVQASWRKSKGRYALHLRFAAQGHRLEEMRAEAALKIQCCYRIYAAKSERYRRQDERNRRRFAAILIQRKVRQYFAQKRYRRHRRSAITIQSGIRGKLAKLQRQRLVIERERKCLAITRIQCWARSVGARILVQRLREKKLLEIQRRRHSALMIQKRARGVEVRKMVSLLREAITLVELEQSRHCPDSIHQNSSELLDFVTKHYFSNPNAVGSKRFTVLEYDWLQHQLELSKQQMAKEDNAIVFLQRYYRGYVCRAAFWVIKVRDQQRRAREKRAAVVIQKVARGFLDRRRVHRRRQQRKLEELKSKYIQERKWKEQEQQWQEQYQREQLEIQIRKAKQLEMKLIHAKREVELAKYQAEAAMYREQERKAHKELEKPQTLVSKRGVDTVSPWAQLQDEYGNIYFYNAATNQSRWDPPPQEDQAESLDRQDAVNTKVKTTNCDDTTKQITLDNTHENTQASQIEKLIAGKCGICKSSRATKQCVQCPESPLYCTSCFTQEHHGPLASTAKSAHDFKVVVKLDMRSRCQSKDEVNKSSESNLATYFCYQCPTPSKSDDKAAVQTPRLGCFYCDDCFQQAHETVQELQHVANAMHFKTGAQLCSECTVTLAVRICEQCDEQLCIPCFDRIHSLSRVRHDHVFTAIEILKEELLTEKDSYCVECDVRQSDRLCNLCGDGFCARCFGLTHAKGMKQSHTWIAWSSFAQAGDWLELFDEKANAKIFFNLETKESTTKQPFVLKNGTERHQLQLAEREQQHKKRELELESELVKVKEQLQAMEEKEAKAAQRPMSRNLLVEGSQRGNGPAAETVAKTKETAKLVKKKKPGILRRLFASGKPEAEEEELTEDEKKRKQLADGVQDAERELILARLRTRSREEKENKARGTVGTNLFEQAMVQELAQSNCVLHASTVMEANQAASLDGLQYSGEHESRCASARQLSTNTLSAWGYEETSLAIDDDMLLGSLLDADDAAIEAVYEMIYASVGQSFEEFYNERLMGYVALSVSRMISEAIRPVIDTREFAVLSQDPVEGVLSQLASKQAKQMPPRGNLDSFSRSEIPVRIWRRPSELYYGASAGGKRSSPPQTPRSTNRNESPISRPSSLCSFKQRKKKVIASSSMPSSTSHFANDAKMPPPGVVFSTGPPEATPRCSPRKAIALVRNVRCLSASTADLGPEVEAPRDKTVSSERSSDEDGSSSGQDEKRLRRDHFSIELVKLQNSDDDESGKEGNIEQNAPVEVVYLIKRSSPGKRGSTTGLPDLEEAMQHSTYTLPILGKSPSQDETSEQFVIEPMTQGFRDMMLSPGVKLQTGDTTKIGPELPMFATRMRKSTFHYDEQQVDPLLLSPSQSPNTTELIVETPRERQLQDFDLLAREDDEGCYNVQGANRSTNVAVDGVPRKSSGALCPTPTQFLKRRPCGVTGQQPHFHDRSSLCKRPSTSSSICTQHGFHGTVIQEQKEDAFREIARQRAFQRKVSTVVSPTRKPTAQATSCRRPTTATIPSPLARRRLTKTSDSSTSTFDKIL